MLEIRNLVLINGHKTIIDCDYMALEEGLYQLLGPNGSGKTTLMRYFAGIKPGKYGYFNSSLKTFYLPEKFNLPKQALVEDILRLFMVMTKSKENIEYWTSRYEIDTSLRIAELSKGMIQRVGIIISMIGGYEFILYDEPFEGLDDKNTRLFISDIKHLKAKYIILSYHRLSTKRRLGFKVLEIKEGRLCMRENI